MAIYYSVVEDDPFDCGGTSRVMEGQHGFTIQGEDGRRGEGSAESGTTDDQGHTHLLATAASEEESQIYPGNAV